MGAEGGADATGGAGATTTGAGAVGLSRLLAQPPKPAATAQAASKIAIEFVALGACSTWAKDCFCLKFESANDAAVLCVVLMQCTVNLLSKFLGNAINAGQIDHAGGCHAADASEALQ
jgi:hypothetical protein